MFILYSLSSVFVTVIYVTSIICYSLCGGDTQFDWAIEARRLVPLIPRAVPQVSYFSSLLLHWILLCISDIKYKYISLHYSHSASTNLERVSKISVLLC